MKMIIIGIVGLVIFGASAAGSWFVKTQVLAPPPEEETTEITDISADPADTPASEDGDGSRQMVVAVRDDPMTVEELFRFSHRLKEQEKQLTVKEDEFQKRQVQQALVLTDVKTEQDAISGLQTKLDKDLTVAEDMIEELNTLRANLKEQEAKTLAAQEALEAAEVAKDGGYESKDKKISGVLQSMTPEKAGGFLQELVNTGQVDFAAQLLSNFDERQAAKILDSIEDMKIVNELILRYREIKKAAPATKK